MRDGGWREVFAAFLRLGLTSFGGPIAHLEFYRRELVVRRRWLDEERYAQLVALAQFLPGPASTQTGFGLGLLRAGWPGAVAAFVGFTLPSALLMLAFAAVLPWLGAGPGAATVQGLKLVALAVVANGVVALGARLCPDRRRIGIAAAVVAVVLGIGGAGAQLAAVAVGAAAGLVACRDVAGPSVTLPIGYGARPALALLGVFALLLIGLPLAASAAAGPAAVAAAFYRAGALVFGGGHVVLPLLKESVVAPGWVGADEFIAGYGAAQAVPGPMFTLAAYLGARLPGELGGVAGAALALAAIFVPGLLLLAGALPLWGALAARRIAARAIAGVNAAVVGLLAAALYDPLWVTAVRGPVDVAIAGIGLLLLVAWRAPALAVVAWCVGAALVIDFVV